MPGKGRGGGDWVARWFKACPRQTMDDFGREATSWIGVGSTRRCANWQAGRQAWRQIVRHAGGWRVKFGIVPRRRPAVALPSDQPCGRVPTQACGLSPMQACRHANRHTGRKADSHDCGYASGRLGRRAAAFRLRESLRNMKVSAPCYNFQHMRFDVSATLCLNGAPDAGRISDAFTKASLGRGLPAVHRLPSRH